MEEKNILDVNEEYFIQCLFKGLFKDKNYLATVSSAYDPNYFDDMYLAELFMKIKSHFERYNKLPDMEIIKNQISADHIDEVNGFLNELDTMEFDVAKNYDWLVDTSDTYLRDRAIKRGLVKAVDLVEEGGNIQEIREIIEGSLCKTMKIDLGINYWRQLGERLKKIFTTTDLRIPTYYPIFDEYLNGGFPPFTLSMFVAQIHGFKCVSYNTYIRINEDGNIKKIKIGDFYKYIYNDELTGETQVPSKQSFINKHGEELGEKKYDEWRENLSKPKTTNAQKGIKKIDLFINKYGKEKGTERYNQWLEKNRENGKKGKGRQTFQWYIEKYGKEEGTKKYQEISKIKSKAAKGINTIKYYIEKYGEELGEKKYHEKNKKISDPGRCTVKWFVEKYGKEEGTKKYQTYIRRQKFSHSEEGYIKRFGEEKGILKWQERMRHLKHSTSLEGFQKRHGEIEGLLLWKKRQETWQETLKSKPLEEIERINRAKMGNYKGFSKISQKLFWSLTKHLNDLSDVYFAELNKYKQKDDSGNNHEYMIITENKDSIFFLDFLKGNKIIEFDGDYWHGDSRGNQERDRLRDEKITSLGYEILRVKERDWKQDKEYIIKTCLEFLNG